MAETAWTGLKWLAPNGVLSTLKYQLLLHPRVACTIGLSASWFPQSQNLWGTPYDFRGWAAPGQPYSHAGPTLGVSIGAPWTCVGSPLFGAPLQPERKDYSCDCSSVLTPLCLVLRGDGVEEKGLLPPPDAKATFHQLFPSDLVSGHQVGAPVIKAHRIRLG